jgi:hypothetical protein
MERTRRSKVALALCLTMAILGAAALSMLIRRSPRSELTSPVGFGESSTTKGTTTKAETARAATVKRPPPRILRPTGVYEPSAYKAITEEGADPIATFDREPRNPRWAPAMEAEIRSDLARNVALLKLPSTALHDIECHGSSCRIQIDFRAEDLEQCQNKGAVHPTELLFMSGGHFATVETDVKVRHGRVMNGPDDSIAVLPDGSFRKTTVLTFGEVEIDPAQYGAWREESRRALNSPEKEADGEK